MQISRQKITFIRFFLEACKTIKAPGGYSVSITKFSELLGCRIDCTLGELRAADALHESGLIFVEESIYSKDAGHRRLASVTFRLRPRGVKYALELIDSGLLPLPMNSDAEKLMRRLLSKRRSSQKASVKQQLASHSWRE